MAQDFVNGILRTLAPETASDKAYYFFSVISVTNAAGYNDGSIKDAKQVGVSAPDDKTVVIQLDNPAPYTLYLMVSFEAAPEALAKKLYAEAGYGPGNPLEVEILSSSNDEA